MSKNTCTQCGLINFAADEACRRCGAALHPTGPIEERRAAAPARARSPWRKLFSVFAVTLALLLVCFASLLLTSDPLSLNERQTVVGVIPILEQAGFLKEAFVLRHLVEYRDTDNWWNLYTGHQEAYAATNCPFEVVTLYPEFFNFAVDDTERAAILLHESYHLFGADEETALESVWREKPRLGWTGDKYSRTKVWRNTREWTAAAVPTLFECGPGGHADCVP